VTSAFSGFGDVINFEAFSDQNAAAIDNMMKTEHWLILRKRLEQKISDSRTKN